MARHLFTIESVAHMTGLKRKELRRLLLTGQFPRPDAYLDFTPGWSALTVCKWNAEHCEKAVA